MTNPALPFLAHCITFCLYWGLFVLKTEDLNSLKDCCVCFGDYWPLRGRNSRISAQKVSVWWQLTSWCQLFVPMKLSYENLRNKSRLALSVGAVFFRGGSITLTLTHTHTHTHSHTHTNSHTNSHTHTHTLRGELVYLAPLGSENISAPYFKQCFLTGGITPRQSNTTPPSPKTEITNILFYVLNFASIIKFKM